MDEKQKTAILREPNYKPDELDIVGGGWISWWHDLIHHEVNACNQYWRSLIKNHVDDG